MAPRVNKEREIGELRDEKKAVHEDLHRGRTLPFFLSRSISKQRQLPF
jgi:hypothetical protein